jgi:hypothetical protein
MPYGDWSKVQDPSRWISYLEERLRSAVEVHRPSNIFIVGKLPTGDAIDRNLYGCTLRLTPNGVGGSSLSAGMNEISEELTFVTLNLLSIEKKIDKILRLARGKSSGRKTVQRMKRRIQRTLVLGSRRMRNHAGALAPEPEAPRQEELAADPTS